MGGPGGAKYGQHGGAWGGLGHRTWGGMGGPPIILLELHNYNIFEEFGINVEIH